MVFEQCNGHFIRVPSKKIKLHVFERDFKAHGKEMKHPSIKNLFCAGVRAGNEADGCFNSSNKDALSP